MMINPSVDELSQGKYNRYTLVIIASKGARLATDEYVRQRENADDLISRKETDKPPIMLIDKEYRTEKPVRIAIRRFKDGEYKVLNAPRADGTLDEDYEANNTSESSENDD